jgi:GTP-binding protein EngB required for normal cell division
MARLSEQLRDWLARAEILAHGSERRRIEGARALEAGRPWEARYQALAILDELPLSPVALALWADAAEAMLLDNEASEALERLAIQVPFRADVWLRLAAVRERLGADPRHELEPAAEVGEPVDAADWARLRLADLDLAAGDPARAERWLGQLSLGSRSRMETLSRRIEVWLAHGETERAREAGRALPEPPLLDGRGWLLRGRVLALDSLAAAESALVRALLLDAPGALSIAGRELRRGDDRRASERLQRVVADLGLAGDPSWRAAVATAEGRRDEALRALADAARQSTDSQGLERYLEDALELRDARAFRDAVELMRDRGHELDPALGSLAEALSAPEPQQALSALDSAGGQAAPWAGELRRAVYRDFWAESGELRPVLAELAEVAGQLVQLEALSEVEAMAVDLERPLRVAIVGEFNAGKSSFINALLGEPVAPVGVLPTTATLNTLVWAPDRFARIERSSPAFGPDRVISHGELKSTLAGLDPASVAKVTLYAPLEPLRRIEILDTPGFNASDAAHAETARRAFKETHAAIWLCDATQPLKESERAVLAEIQDAGLPLVVLVNKVDRLDPEKPEQLAAALEHVQSGLSAAGLSVEAAPIAFSARLALSARTGDSSALSRSGWSEVESLLERVLVDRSDLLRERVLRRRARGIAARLGSAASERAAERRRLIDRAEARSAGLRAAAARVSAERAKLQERLGEHLDVALAALDRELRPLRGSAEEAAAQRFVAARARSTLGTPLTRAILDWLGLQAPVARYLEPRLEPRVMLVAAAVAPWLRSDEVRGRRGSAGPDDRALARAQLLTLLVDEVARVAEDGVTENAVPPAPAAEGRALALAEVLSA